MIVYFFLKVYGFNKGEHELYIKTQGKFGEILTYNIEKEIYIANVEILTLNIFIVQKLLVPNYCKHRNKKI